jgi:hypothetical protein
MARMMLALGYQWLKEHAPQHLTESKAPAWETLPMADVPHPSKDGTRVVGFVVPNRGVEIPRQQLRELIGKPHPRDEQANWIAPVQGYTPGIPWSMHLEAYDVYRKEYGRQEALIDYRAGCRGGFGTSELDAWIPGWRERASEITALKAELVKTKEALHIALADAVMPARKVGGNYEAEGTIVSTFQTLAGKTRHVFEFSNPEGMLHIFGPEQVEIAGAVNGAPPPDCRDAMIESGLPAIPKSCPACGIAKHCARTGLEQKVPQ